MVLLMVMVVLEGVFCLNLWCVFVILMLVVLFSIFVVCWIRESIKFMFIL